MAPLRVDQAQAALGLLFPPSYRSFLETYGAALCAGFEIAGIPDETGAPDETPMWLDVVKDTLSYRPDSLPRDSVAISADGAENVYFLRCSRSDPEYEGPVIEWGPEHDGGKECASGFLEFLELLRDRLLRVNHIP